MKLTRNELITKLFLPVIIILIIMSGVTLAYIDEQNEVDKGEANYDLSYRYYLKNEGPYNLTRLSLRLALIKSWEPVQTLNDITVSLQENRSSSDEYENNFLWYEFEDFQVGDVLDVTINVNLTLHMLDYSGFNFGDITYDHDSNIYKLFTAYNPLADTTDIRIQNTADQLTTGMDQVINQVFSIYNFSSLYLRYKLLSRARGATFALTNGYGDCDEYQDLFIALARSKGIPAVGHTAWFADFQTGMITSDDGSAAHAYPMFYVPTVGMLPADPTRGKDAIYDNWLKTDYKVITMTRGPNHPYRLLNYKWIPEASLGEPNIFSNYTISIHNLDINYSSKVRRIVLSTIVAIPVVFISTNVIISRWDLAKKRKKLERILSPTLASKEKRD